MSTARPIDTWSLVSSEKHQSLCVLGSVETWTAHLPGSHRPETLWAFRKYS